MSANRSAAVMQQRHTAPDELDYFPTPPFATRALCEFLEQQLGELGGLDVWEPAAGERHMTRPLGEYFRHVRASDVFPYDDELELLDFATVGQFEPDVDGVATNPPFNLGAEFIETALGISRRFVAMLVRVAFAEGGERYERLFRDRAPTFELVFVERVVMLKGRLVRKGAIDHGADEAGKRASTATAYCWMIWLRDDDGQWNHDTRKRWIPPAFARLERPGDYPEQPLEILPPPADGLFGVNDA